MTPHQGDTPNEPRGRQPPESEYQQPPNQQPQQPPDGQYQGQPGQQGQPMQQGQSRQQGQSIQPGQPTQQPQQGQPQARQQHQGAPPQGQTQPGQQYQGAPPQGQTQPGQQYQGAPPQGQTQQTQPQSQSGGMQSEMAQPAGQSQPGGQMQPPQVGSQGRQSAQFSQQQGMQAEPGPRLRPIRVEEILDGDAVTAERDTPISEVVSLMSTEDVGSVIVVEDDKPVGILTDRKIALALENTPDIANKEAGELISGDLITGTTEMTVFDVLDQFSEEKIRRLPIVDDDSTIEGVVTLDDLLVLLGSEFNKVSETIAGQTSRI